VKINLLRSIQGFLMTILLILTIVVQPATAASGAIAETQKSNYAPNETIVVEYSNFPSDDGAWIAIAPSDFADANYNGRLMIYTYGSRSGSQSFNGHGLTVGDMRCVDIGDTPIITFKFVLVSQLAKTKVSSMVSLITYKTKSPVVRII
jgi:hypothetical protein